MRIFIVPLLAVLALAACSSGTDTTAEDAGTASSLAVSPGGDVVATPPESESSAPGIETLPTAGSVDPSPAAEQKPSMELVELGPEPRPKVDVEDFPDHVALLVQPVSVEYFSYLEPNGSPVIQLIKSAAHSQLERIYKGSDGRLVTETVVTMSDFLEAFPQLFPDADVLDLAMSGFAASPDGSHVFAAVCVARFGCEGVAGLPEKTELFWSADGGRTWDHLLTLLPRMDQVMFGAVAGDQGEGPQVVLSNDEGYSLYPNGRSLESPEPPEGYGLAWLQVRDGQLIWRANRSVAPGQLYLREGEREWLPIPDEQAAWPWDTLRHDLGTPTYTDPETGAAVPLSLPPDTLPLDSLWRPPQDDYPGSTYRGQRWSLVGLQASPD